MPDFLFPELLGPAYATLIAAVSLPILIHLINMLRHRRVEWAAMEFLLLSQKKNRTWVRLKQLLLLLLRMAALAAVAFLVAQPLLHNQLGSLFGTTSTHHIVLLDDSFSMSDHWADTTAFADAKKAIARLGTAAADRAEAQTFTLVRFSRVGRIGRGSQLDMEKETVNRQFVKDLDEKLAKMQVSQSAAGPIEALKAIGQLLGEGKGERRIVYLFSDFRQRDWDEPTEVQKLLLELNQQEVEIRLVNCVDRVRPNLAVAALTPAEGIQAARVPFDMEVSVENFGKEAVRDVTVQLEEDGHARPAVVIPRIPPGRTVTQRFPVIFPTAGEHQVTAKLDGDAVALDNFRYATVRLPAEVPVLMVDSDPEAMDAKLMSIAAAPGGAVRTGIRPQIETPRYLSIKSLDDFLVVNLLNIDHLDRSAVEAIERFVKAGGGVAVFLGERSQTKFINDELYRSGQGFFPLPVKGPADLAVDRLEREPDIEAGDHYVFRVFADAGSPFAASVTVSRYFAVPDNWRPAPDSTVEVIAKLRNGAPLAVAKSFGKGRVVAFLTSAAPTWNNWARWPSFVVVMQDLEAYLAHRTALGVSRQVGTPLELQFESAKYLPAVRFIGPGNDSATASVDATPAAGGLLNAVSNDTDFAGVYQAVLTRTDNENVPETRRFAFNVDPTEGNLETVPKTDLAARLEGVSYLYEDASAFQYAMSETAGHQLDLALLVLLILLLVAEQAVAWWASYHPAARLATAKGGAR